MVGTFSASDPESNAFFGTVSIWLTLWLYLSYAFHDKASRMAKIMIFFMGCNSVLDARMIDLYSLHPESCESAN